MTILTGDGMKPTTVRYAEGVPIGGQSSYEDVTTGGGDYVFTRVSHAPVGDIVWRGDRLMRRLDWTAHDDDAYGATNPFADWSMYGRKARNQRSWLTLSGGRSYEVMFKGRLSWADVEKIHMSSRVRADVLARLKRAGITHIGGRRVEDIIGTSPY
jgi:hypothetical protein